MYLNRAVEYGIEGLAYLARFGNERCTLLREVSRATSIPETFLSKIFQRLVQSGFIHSRRGFRGGFSLAKPASQITLREIIEALQGPIVRAMPEQRFAGQPFTARAQVALHQVLEEAQARLRAVLDETTVADLAAAGGRMTTKGHF